MRDAVTLDHIPPARTRPRRGIVALSLALAALIALLGALVAPAASAADKPCVADATTGCIRGTIFTDTREPAAGVQLTAVGPDGTATATTAKDGTWNITVKTAGDYKVTLDPDTLPAGQTLRDPGSNPRTVPVALGNFTAALFPLGTPSAGGTGTGATSSPTDNGSGAVDVGSAPSEGGVTWGLVAQQAAAGLIFGILLALASVGLSLIYGTTGLSNFAHGEQVTLGAILAYIGTQIIGLPLLVAGAIAVIIGAFTGWLQDKYMWNPLRKRHVGMTQQMIVTIGLSIALQYTYQFFFGASPLRIVRSNPTTVDIGPIELGIASLWSAGIAIVALGGVAYFLLRTRTGRATRAVSDNPALASASGIGVDRIIRLVWILGAGLAALGGVLMGLYLNATSWEMGASLLLLMFAAVTLGGLGEALGALVGSIVIGLVAEMSSLVIPTDTRYAGALLILVLVLLFRPQGILGRAERIG